LYDLPAGKYRLLSYHNCFNGRRIGDKPTAVEYTSVGRPEPPMPSIKVYSMKTILTEYFNASLNDRVKGKSYHTPAAKLIIAGKQGTGDVSQTIEATNVEIQQVKNDAELKPSVTEFITDGSPLVVVYAGGCCKSDDLRPQRSGGYATLNAFELRQLSGAVPPE
jgi:hypothetical protein